MAITTRDGALAGMLAPQQFVKAGVTMEAAGVWHSTVYMAGRPGAFAVPSPGMAGAALTSYAGQIPFTNPVSGNSYLASLQATCSAAGVLMLCDRLWHNSGIVVTTTTAQTINSVAWPARDSGGTTNGDGVMVGIEVSTATTGAAMSTVTMSYTNSAGASGKVGTIGAAAPSNFPATAVAGTFVPINLAAGDVGVRSVQSLTLGTTLGGGVVHLVAYRILAMLGVPTPNAAVGLDILSGGFPRLYDNSVPFLIWIPSAATAATLGGAVVYTQG